MALCKEMSSLRGSMIDINMRLKWDVDIFPPVSQSTKGKYLSKEHVRIRHPATMGLIVVRQANKRCYV